MTWELQVHHGGGEKWEEVGDPFGDEGVTSTTVVSASNQDYVSAQQSWNGLMAPSRNCWCTNLWWPASSLIEIRLWRLCMKTWPPYNDLAMALQYVSAISFYFISNWVGSSKLLSNLTLID